MKHVGMKFSICINMELYRHLGIPPECLFHLRNTGSVAGI